MVKAVRGGLGVLLVLLTLTGCGAPAAAPALTAERECERSGGTWRFGACVRQGGGGY